MDILELKELEYDEVAKCNRCGFCLTVCPTYNVMKTERQNARGRNALTRASIEERIQLSEEVVDSLFNCLGCGACEVACLPKVQTKEIVRAERTLLVDSGIYPDSIKVVAESLEKNYNISDEDNEDRAEWREDVPDLPDTMYEKDRAEVVYFVGCVSSFFPMVQKIPQNFVQIMDKGDLDFTLLGGKEGCCGFPLLQAGMPKKAEKLIEHNLEKIQEVGAKTVVFSCPSCYRTWNEFYDTDVELLHSSHLLEQLVKEKKVHLKELNITVTYHDPCDLGRNSDVYEPPREVLKMIPGLKLVELKDNRQKSVCCGGGGDVEMANPDLTSEIAQMKIDEIEKTGADIVVTPCQQCIRTISTRARKQGIKLKVMDLTEIVMMAMK
jgi:heterodisulfide reductase subunit D